MHINKLSPHLEMSHLLVERGAITAIVGISSKVKQLHIGLSNSSPKYTSSEWQSAADAET